MTSADAQRMRAPFDAMLAAWTAIAEEASTRYTTGWQQAFQRIAEHQKTLVSAGLWLSGPADLMRLLAVNDLELMHSKVVAWLLTPTGRHGLGDRILASILAIGWPEKPATAARAIVDLEVSVSATRADIVVYMPEATLVIENKVWASENVYQCESLFKEWAGSRDDVRFLLLTRDGHPPRSTRTPTVADSWRSLSYRSLGTLLRDALREAPVDGLPGRSSAEQYLATLQAMSLVGGPFEVRVGGGHVDA